MIKLVSSVALSALCIGSASAVVLYNYTPEYSDGVKGWTSQGKAFESDVWRTFTPVKPEKDTYLRRIDFYAFYVSNDPLKIVTPSLVTNWFEVATWEDGANNVPYGVADAPFFADTGRTLVRVDNASTQLILNNFFPGWSLYRVQINLSPRELEKYGNPGILRGGVQSWVSITSLSSSTRGYMAMISGASSVNPIVTRQNYFNGDLNTWNQFNYLSGFDLRLEGSLVPEPASMIALGIGALALVRKRRSSK